MIKGVVQLTLLLAFGLVISSVANAQERYQRPSRFVQPLINPNYVDPNEQRLQALDRAAQIAGSVVEMERADRQEALARQQYEQEVARQKRDQAISQAQYELQAVQQRQEHLEKAYFKEVASLLAKVNPDSAGAESFVYQRKGDTAQYLNAEALQQLFAPMERRLEMNRQRLSDIYQRTGYATPVVDPNTGLIDWEATWIKAEQHAGGQKTASKDARERPDTNGNGPTASNGED